MTDKLKSPSQEGVELDALTPIFDIPPSYEFISGAHLRQYDETLKEFMSGAAIGGTTTTGETVGIESFPFELKFDDTFTVAKDGDDSIIVTSKAAAGQGGSITVKGDPKNPSTDPSTFPSVNTINFAKGAKIYPPATGITNEVMLDFGFEVSNEGTIIDTNKIEFIGMDVTAKDGKAIVAPIGTEKLTDRHFTILTVQNGISAWTASTKALPYSLIQDPMCNVAIPTGGDIIMPQITGMYAVTKYIHFTGKDEWAGKKATVVFRLQQRSGAVKFSMTTELTADSRGEFPTAKFYKRSVSLEKNEQLQVMISITVDGKVSTAEEFKTCEMDPYKNILALEKAESKTHTGALIAFGLFDSLGGVSYQPGVEIRGEYVPSSTPGESGTYQVGAESFNKTIVVVTV